MNFINKKYLSNPSLGFSLAEVLITIGIIGIISVMTIPILLVNKAKEETVSQLKKEYTSLAQAVRTSELENGDCGDWNKGTTQSEANVKSGFETYWSPYLNIIKYCNTYTECGYKNGVFNYLNKSGFAGITDVTTRTCVLLADGSVVMVLAFASGIPTQIIFIDINGAKNPNTYGKDVFEFVLDTKKGFMPYGHNLDYDSVKTNCSSDAVGNYCAARIMKDGWKIVDDYPWE